MPVPSVSTNFGDLLDPRFQEIAHDRWNQLPDMLPELFDFPPDNGREDMRWSEVGAFPDIDEFTGSVNYLAQNQGFDVTQTHIEFAGGMQVEYKLYLNDQYHIMDQRPSGLTEAAHRTRQGDGARIFINSFATDSRFYSHSEGVPLCSNSHITTSGASTANGFDNLQVSALSGTAVAANRISMVGFRGDQAERISIVPDEILIPPDLYEIAYEIIASMGQVDTAQNNRNVHEGAYRLVEWNYLSDTNDWWMMDGSMRKRMLKWVDRVSMQFAMAEDIDTMVAKWRLYMYYSNVWTNWRWILGNQVS